MRKTTPNILFIAAAFIIAGGYLTVSAAGVFVTNELRIGSTIQEASERLKNSDLAQTKVILRENIDYPPLEYRLIKLVEGEKARDRLELAFNYLQAPESVKLGQRSRLNTAKAWIEKEGSSPVTAPLLEGLERAYATLETIELENSKFLGYGESSSRLNSDYLIVAKRFGSLLNLEAVEPSIDGPELPVYKNGYLTGLPKLTKLRDEIESVEQLGERLGSIGGKVTIEGPQVATAFDEEISAIRSLTVALVKSRQELRSQQEGSEKRRSELKRELSKVAEDVAKLTAAQLDQIAESGPKWADGRAWYRDYRQKIEGARDLVLGFSNTTS